MQSVKSRLVGIGHLSRDDAAATSMVGPFGLATNIAYDSRMLGNGAYGDLYPSTDVGRTIAMISSLMGVAVVALPSGIITAGMPNLIAQNRKANCPKLMVNP